MFSWMLTIGETLILEPRDNEQDEKYKCTIVEKSEDDDLY